MGCYCSRTERGVAIVKKATQENQALSKRGVCDEKKIKRGKGRHP